jgi:hypothetical protein
VAIAPLWDDLRTTGTGEDIFIDAGTPDQVTIRWAAETVAAPNAPCNFAVTLYRNGKIRLHYGSGNTGLTPTVGISRGTGSQYTLSTYDGDTSLTNVNSHEFAPPTILPMGMTLSAGGVLSGTPTETGAFNPLFKVADALGFTDQRALSLTIQQATPPVFDCDGNGAFDLSVDLPCFINALLGVQPPAGWNAVDLNHDGLVDGLDIQAFVSLVVP